MNIRHATAIGLNVIPKNAVADSDNNDNKKAAQRWAQNGVVIKL